MVDIKFRTGSSHDRLMQSAKYLFATRGYDETSTAMIARAAGTSESQLVKHFGSKSGLLEAVFESGWATVNAYAEAAEHRTDAVERLRGLLLLTVEALDRDPEFKQLVLLEARRVRSGEGPLVTAGFRQFASRVDHILNEMEREGGLKAELNTRALRSGLLGLVEGVLREDVLAQRFGRPAAYGDGELNKMLDVFLGAVSVPHAALAAD
jgi:AcrR family transcriptional regulator